ncbi:MAG: DUF975 family protein [Acetatifactor sp.]|nr:DUF975 family protein [Acetatifactor sp.]
MNKYKTSAELKDSAREILRGKYGSAVLTIFVMFLANSLIVFVPTLIISMITLIIEMVVGGVSSLVTFILGQVVSFIALVVVGLLKPGIALYFLNITCGRKAATSDLMYGIQWDFQKTLKLSLVFSVIEFFCLLPYGFLESPLLSLVPIERFLYAQPAQLIGILLSTLITLPLSLVYYLMLDFPSYSVAQLLKQSIRLMKCNNLRMLYLHLSFLPLEFLGVCSLGVGFLWILPYLNVTKVLFFLNLMKPDSAAE